MLNDCDHGECIVVYDTKTCPMCDLVSEKESMEKDLQGQLESATSEIDDLVSQVDELA